MNWPLLAFGSGGWGDELLRGLALTLSLAFSSFGLGLVVGCLAEALEMGGGWSARIASGYGVVMRSLPELLVIFIVYFGLGFVIEAALSAIGVRLAVSIPPFAAGVIALSAISGAYASEVVKGAVRAVPAGLGEAGLALGLVSKQVRRRVTWPLALRYAFPGFSNVWMSVIKKTPLVSAIQLEDFIRAAGTAGQNTKYYFFFYGIVIAVYLMLSAITLVVQDRLERRLFRHLKPVAS
jgi:His/Glu/Gln/Arg/opine family amino acid ABC transporter permease subunit